MTFHYYEWMALLRNDGMAAQKVATTIGRSARHVRRVRNDERKHSYRWEQNLSRVAFERLKLPWSLEAQSHIDAIRNLFQEKELEKLYNLFGFPTSLMLDHVLTFETKDADAASAVLWGQALTVFWTIYALRSSQDKGLSSRFTESDFERVVAVLQALLDTKPKTGWADLLRYKVVFPLFTLTWNALDRKSDDRRSEKMRQWLDKTGVRHLLLAYNDLVPLVPEAPFGALAIASRFQEQDSYRDILGRLQVADERYRTIIGIKRLRKTDGYFDEDFDDFATWAMANPDLFEQERKAM